MDTVGHVSDLLQNIGRAAGIPLTLDDGLCGIELSDGNQVVVAVPPGIEDVIWLYSPVAEIGRTNIASVAEKALKINFFGDGMGGCWLAADDEMETLFLCASRPASKLDPQAFENLFSNFSKLAMRLSADFSTLESGQETADGNPPGNEGGSDARLFHYYDKV